MKALMLKPIGAALRALLCVGLALCGCGASGSDSESPKSEAVAPPAQSAPKETPKPAPPVDSQPPDERASSLAVGKTARPLEFRDSSGKLVKLADLKGKAVVVMFFSTDCPHCQATAKMLGPIYREYRAKGVEILALAVNPSAATNLGGFIRDHQVEFPIGLGTRSQWVTFGSFPMNQNTYVPHMMFVSKDGVMAADHPGQDRAFWAQQDQLIRQELDRLLSADPSA